MFKWFYEWAVPVEHREILAHHPLAFWFSLGVVISGLVAFAHPESGGAPALALPDWLHYVFNTAWTLGGTLAVYGIVRGKARWEAAGMTLLGTSFVCYFLSIIYVLPSSAWSGGFLLAIAIGCFRRAKVLALGTGYEQIVTGEKWVP